MILIILALLGCLLGGFCLGGGIGEMMSAGGERDFGGAMAGLGLAMVLISFIYIFSKVMG